MNKIEIVYFAVILFSTLVVLSKWKHRRDRTTGRINRGLHSYLCRKPNAIEDAEDDLLAVQ